jgi:hypothetical protein
VPERHAARSRRVLSGCDRARVDHFVGSASHWSRARAMFGAEPMNVEQRSAYVHDPQLVWTTGG